MIEHIKVLLNAAKLGCVTCPSNPYGQERYNFAMENKIEYKYDCSMNNCSRYVAIKEVERQIEETETKEKIMYGNPQEMKKSLEERFDSGTIPREMLRYYQDWRVMLWDKINQECSLYVLGRVNGVIVQRIMPLPYKPESKEEETELAHECLRRGMVDNPKTSLWDVMVIEKGDTVPIISDEQLHACIEFSETEEK